MRVASHCRCVAARRHLDRRRPAAGWLSEGHGHLQPDFFVGAGADVLLKRPASASRAARRRCLSQHRAMNPGRSRSHYNDFSSQTETNLDEGIGGNPSPSKADAQWQLRLMTEGFWGLARRMRPHRKMSSGTIRRSIPTTSIRSALSPEHRRSLDLYIGPTANQRFVPLTAPAAARRSTMRQRPLWRTAAIDSETCDIYIDSGNSDDRPARTITGTQVINGAVNLIVANTGSVMTRSASTTTRPTPSRSNSPAPAA